MTFKLSEISQKRLVGVNDKWHRIIAGALTTTKVDFGIPKYGGIRTAEEQNKLYKDGSSKADGYDKLSYHQSGDAIDFYAYIDGKASWRQDHLAMVAAAIIQSSSSLGYGVEWGGLWRSIEKTDGIPYGWDSGHIQLAD